MRPRSQLLHAFLHFAVILIGNIKDSIGFRGPASRDCVSTQGLFAVLSTCCDFPRAHNPLVSRTLQTSRPKLNSTLNMDGLMSDDSALSDQSYVPQRDPNEIVRTTATNALINGLKL